MGIEGSAKITEIAFIAGQLTKRKEIDTGTGDLHKHYLIFKKIYEDWALKKDVQTEEEQTHISVYAARVLKKKFAVMH